MGTIRRAVPEDSQAIWALNELPNLGATADPSLPLELAQPSEPPAAFPDLTATAMQKAAATEVKLRAPRFCASS